MPDNETVLQLLKLTGCSFSAALEKLAKEKHKLNILEAGNILEDHNFLEADLPASLAYSHRV